MKAKHCPALKHSQSPHKMSHSKTENKETNEYKSEKYECCKFCHCHCHCSITGSAQDKNNNAKKRKRKPKKAMKPLRSTRDCIILKDVSIGLPNVPSKNDWPTADNIDLCESLQNLCLSPRVLKAYKKVPVHDKKILNRMAKSRIQKAILTENAWLAQKIWENEKCERELAKCEQEEQYRKVIRQKQLRDAYVTQARLQTISKRKQQELQKLRDELYIRDLRLQDRLKNLKLQRRIIKCEKGEDELRKTEAVLHMLEKQQLEDELQKQEIFNSLQCRMSRADYIRQRYLDAYSKRLKHDNYMEQVLHEENYKEAQIFEEYKNEALKESIKRKDKRTNKFIERRGRNYKNIVEKAKLSADLRDLVRRSVSPDGLQFGTARQFYDRPSSILSFKSFVKMD